MVQKLTYILLNSDHRQELYRYDPVTKELQLWVNLEQKQDPALPSLPEIAAAARIAGLDLTRPIWFELDGGKFVKFIDYGAKNAKNVS